MTKFHINPKTGNPNKCQARYNCPFGDVKDHYDSKEEARKGYEKIMAKKAESEARRRAPMAKLKKSANDTVVRPPIVYKPMDNFAPSAWGSGMLDATDVEPLDYYSDAGYTSFSAVSGEKAVEIATGIDRKNWNESLKALYKANEDEWNNVNSWDVEYGYYENEIPYVTAPSGFEEKLKTWYYSNPNAKDEYGILEHVRGKGFDTAGLTPVEAVKKLLREENGISLKWIEAATHATSAKVSLDKLRINNTHYSEVEAREATPAIKSTKAITGIAHYSSRDGFRLLDGYHRLKHAKNAGQTEGEFLIIR